MADVMERLFPPFGLRISCGPLSLRVIREHDFAEVFEALERDGIYDDDRPMPFLFAWDAAGRKNGWIDTMRFYWSSYSSFTADSWNLLLRVECDGAFAGFQDVCARQGWRDTRTFDTGSWLLLPHQGRGMGTLMRQTVCTFAVDHLGAEELTSGYIAGNDRSAAVSRKVGYRDNGTRRLRVTDGAGWRQERLVTLRSLDLVRPPYPVEVEGMASLAAFIGLAESDAN